jgi:hypothetical protein
VQAAQLNRGALGGRAVSHAKTTLVIMAGVTWFGGLMTLAAHYSRRPGTPRWSKGTFPFNHFNSTEWLLFVLTIVVSLFLFLTGLSLEGP